MYLHVVTLLESVGFTFGLDFDNELMIEYPLEFDPKCLADKLATEHVQEITNFLKRRGEQARRQFLGGPLDGEAYWELRWVTVQLVEPTRLATFGYHFHRTAPAAWAIYLAAGSQDGRAFFRGTATSEKKAKRKMFDLIFGRSVGNQA